MCIFVHHCVRVVYVMCIVFITESERAMCPTGCGSARLGPAVLVCRVPAVTCIHVTYLVPDLMGTTHTVWAAHT